MHIKNNMLIIMKILMQTILILLDADTQDVDASKTIGKSNISFYISYLSFIFNVVMKYNT